MDRWICHTILLCIPSCLALVQNQGPDALSDETGHIFPQSKVFERGSNVTFCCIAKKNNYVTGFTFYEDFRFVETQQQRALFTRTPASSFPGRFQFACVFSNSANIRATYLYLTRQPDKPQNLSCEIEDMIYIKCTWDPGYVEMASYFEKVCPMEFILSDVTVYQFLNNTYISDEEDDDDVIHSVISDSWQFFRPGFSTSSNLALFL